MIRYALPRPDTPDASDEQALAALIEAAKPGWLARAEQRAAAFFAAGQYDESSGIWREIKGVYERLQACKCGFCEAPLPPSADGGAVDQDVEHFRPKKNVEAWKSKENPGLPTGGAFPGGYYMLAYSPLNYLLSCKVCNSPHKHDYFPIQDQRSPSTSRDPKDYATERPYLIYPIGELDDDPEDHLEFLGFMILPRSIGGQKSVRGQVMIEVLNLNRSDLMMQRAKQIRLFHNDFFGDTHFLSGPEPHTACLRAFKHLVEEHPTEAEWVLAECLKLIKSKSSGTPAA